MKKILAMAVLAAASTSIFAQEDVVKEAKSLLGKGQTAEAIQVLTPALSTGSAQSKAAAYNQLAEINFKIFSDQQEIILNNQIKQTQTPHDTLAMNNAVYGMIDAAVKCDEFDNQPNEKGKVKPKYRSANATKYFLQRQQLINPGLDMFNTKNYEGAAKYWGLYIDSYNAPLFEKQDKSTDKNLTQIAYYAALANYNLKDYAKANKYATIAQSDTAFAKDALEIVLFTQKETAKTKEDTLAFVNKLKELHAATPGEDRYFGMMNEYYSQKGNEAAKKAWLDEELSKFPNNKMAWAIKGEDAMNEKNWDEAIADFDKATSIDPSFVQVYYNSAVCEYSKALEMNDKFSDKSGRISADNAAKVKAELNKAMDYVNKMKELDPNGEKVNWEYMSNQINYLLQQ